MSMVDGAAGDADVPFADTASVVAIVAVGAILSLFHLVRIVTATDDFWIIVSGGGTSMLLSLAVVGIGVWAGLYSDGGDSQRLAAWCLGGTAIFVLMASFSTVFIPTQGAQVPLWPRLVGGGGSVGALFGSILGIYDVRQVRARRRWRTATDRAENLNERLRRSNERLMVLNRVLRHNVRNDLNVVVGRAELIANRHDGEDARDARAIVDVAERLVDQSDKARTLETLMDAQGEAHTIDLVTVVERELSILGQEYPDITVEVDVPDTQPVEAAPSLDTAVANVLENAAKHNDAADPCLSVSLTREDDTVELTIVDNGPGIPTHELDVLDAGAETKLKHSSGLGLWTAVWVLENSGGDIEFADNDPRGTVVTMWLRAAEAATSPDYLDAAAVEDFVRS